MYKMDAKNKGKKRSAIIYIAKRKNYDAIVILEELTISPPLFCILGEQISFSPTMYNIYYIC